VSPSFTSRSPSTPATGAGTSIATLSVSRLTMGSSSATVSPGFLSHWPTVASVTDSPSVGTLTSVAMMLSFALLILVREKPRRFSSSSDGGFRRAHCGPERLLQARPVR
jgi:hypothetical protein